MARARWTALLAALNLVAALPLAVSLRLASTTDYLYSRLVKDPERSTPAGDDVVAPSDGTVLYVREVRRGQVPVVIKSRAEIALSEWVRSSSVGGDGLLIGIYMNTFGVHINRAPIAGQVIARSWYNGPQEDMSETERRVILASLLPNVAPIRKLFGLDAEAILSDATYVTESARETLRLENASFRCAVVRIADFWVGRILTWVPIPSAVAKGQRIGMITWGSQTDVFVEAASSGSLRARVREGDRVRAGETVLVERERP